MKITILFLALISLSFVASNEMCRNVEIKVYSSIQPISQSFNLDVKKIKGIDFKVDASEFRANNLVPIEQVGFVLEKTVSSKVLDVIQHKYLRNEPESVWMPYSYAGDWSRNGFVITNQMKRTSASKTEQPLVSFEFVTDFDLKSVTSDDMDKFLNNLKFNSDKRKAIKTTVKNSIMTSHDSYTSNSKAFKEMKEKNVDARTQISKLKKSLQTTIVDINTLHQEEKSLEHIESVKSASLSSVNESIDDIIGKLTVLNAQLKKEELELKEIKPTDVKQLQTWLSAALLNVQYPQKSPERFLEEYSNATTNKYTIIKDNYDLCNTSSDLLEKCGNANMKSSQTKRKLRRSFF